MDESYSLGHFKFVSDAVLNFYLITRNAVSKADQSSNYELSLFLEDNLFVFHCN